MSTGRPPAPWRRLEQARPLRAWRQSQLGAVASLLQDAQQRWQEAWGLPSSPGGVTCASATGQDVQAAWQFAGAAGPATAWIALPTGFDEDLACALWGSRTAAGPVATRIAAACGRDLRARLCACLQVQADAPQLGELQRAHGAWSGAVRAGLAGGACLLVDAAAVERLCNGMPELAHAVRPGATAAPLAPVANAIAGLPFPLRVRLADCELDLASLQDLRIGDIVPLPHRLDAPLQVRDAREELVFCGYLARLGQCKALELASAATAVPQPH